MTTCGSQDRAGEIPLARDPAFYNAFNRIAPGTNGRASQDQRATE
jgi:hypothetical protein